MRISRLRVLLYFTFVQTIVLYSLVYVCEETWQYWGRLLLVDDKIRSGHLEHLSDKVPRKAIIRPVITRYRLSYCWNDRHEFSHLRVSSLLPIIPYVIIEDFWFLKNGSCNSGIVLFQHDYYILARMHRFAMLICLEAYAVHSRFSLPFAAWYNIIMRPVCMFKQYAS